MSTFSRLLAVALGLGVAVSASATQYVTNGNFSATTATSSRQMSDDNNKGGAQYVTGWTNTTANSAGTAGYNFIMMGATQATTSGGVQTDDNGTLSLWAATNSDTIGGSGGNFLAADGAYETSEIYQTLTGLTAGQQYDVSFNWAGAQQSGYTGTTTDNWTVRWGSSLTSYVSQQTATVTDQSQSFTGWMSQTFTFTATGSSQVLGFLATGTPNGQPPFALLDDVSVTEHAAAAVPEPASWAMMIGGFGLVGASLRRRHGAVLLTA